MISKELLQHAIGMLPVASGENYRTNINGVLLRSQAGNVTLVATNGHCLIEKTFSKGLCPDGEYMLRKDAVAALKLVIKEHKYESEIDCSIDSHGSLFVGSDTGSKARIEKNDTKSNVYPDYNQIIPKHANPVKVGLNAQYLLDIAKSLSFDAKTPMITIAFDPFNVLKPIMVTCGENQFGVVMPCRTDAKAWEIPAHMIENLKASES